MISSTVRMRLTGLTVRQLLVALVTTSPLLMILASWATGRLHPSPSPLLFGSAALALVPWLARGWLRRAWAAQSDDIAVHAGGEAVPYKTLTRVHLECTATRHMLVLERSGDLSLRLVWWDALGGALEPRQALVERLAKAGFTVEE